MRSVFLKIVVYDTFYIVVTLQKFPRGFAYLSEYEPLRLRPAEAAADAYFLVYIYRVSQPALG